MEILECLEYGAGLCRNEDMIIGLRARVEAAEAQLAAVRVALGGYPDSDLASLATTLRARVDAVERELEQARDYVDNAIGNTNPAVPLVDRIVRLVSMLAASSTTMPGLDDAVDNHTVDALARRAAGAGGCTRRTGLTPATMKGNDNGRICVSRLLQRHNAGADDQRRSRACRGGSGRQDKA